MPPREKWFHGKIARKNAETILLQRAQDGAFLVRESENQIGDFSLSFRYVGMFGVMWRFACSLSISV